MTYSIIGILIVLYIILNIIDHRLTSKLIYTYNASELNPIMIVSQKLLKEKWYLVKYFFLISFTIIILLINAYNSMLATVITSLINLIYGYVIWHNWKELKTIESNKHESRSP